MPYGLVIASADAGAKEELGEEERESSELGMKFVMLADAAANAASWSLRRGSQSTSPSVMRAVVTRSSTSLIVLSAGPRGFVWGSGDKLHGPCSNMSDCAGEIAFSLTVREIWRFLVFHVCVSDAVTHDQVNVRYIGGA